MAGFTFADATDVATGFEAAANASVEGMGIARVQAAAEGVGEQTVTVVAFAVGPDPAYTEMDLFAAILDGMASGMGAAHQVDDDLQAFIIESTDATSIMGPWGGGPYTVFLLVTGPDGPSREVYAALSASGPGGD